MKTNPNSPSVVSLVADSSRTGTFTPQGLDFLSDQIGGRLINDDGFLEAVIGKMITEKYIDSISRAVAARASDPFDSIYISDLKPDIIPATAIAEIERAAGITDVSSSIRFADDFD